MMNYTKSIYGTVESVGATNNIIGGFYGSDTVDVDGHIIFREDYETKMMEYLEWGNVRNIHKEPVGVLSSYTPSHPMGWNYLEVQIIDNNIMEKVRAGVYKGFSIGIKADEGGLTRIPLSQIDPSKYMHLPQAVINRLKRIGYVIRIKDFYISEISITDRPKNVKSKIIILKSDDVDGDTIPSLTGEEALMDENTTNMEIENETVDNTNVENPELDVNKGESETVVETPQEEEENHSDVVADTSIDKGDTEENSEYADSDSSSDILKSIHTEIARLGSEVQSLMTLVKSVEEKFDTGVAQIAAISKSESVEVETPVLNIEEIKTSISDIIKSELEAFTKLELSPERKNTINKGESGEEEVQPLNVKTMEKSDAYGVIAGIIARHIKK